MTEKDKISPEVESDEKVCPDEQVEVQDSIPVEPSCDQPVQQAPQQIPLNNQVPPAAVSQGYSYPAPGPAGQPMPGQPMPGQPMPGQPMPGQPMPGFAQQGAPVPPPITPLVLGIMSILFGVFFGIVGLVLGIIAIVSGNKQIKTYGEAWAKNAKPGRICGIVGVILSVIHLIVVSIVIALTVALGAYLFDEILDDPYYAANDPFTIEAQVGSASGDEKAVRQGATTFFDDLLDNDNGYIAVAVQELIDGVDAEAVSGEDFSFKASGISAQDIADELLEDATFTIDSVVVHGDTATVNVTVHSKTLVAQFDVFGKKVEDYTTLHPDWSGSHRAFLDIMSELYMDSFDETGFTTIPLIVTFEMQGNEWVIADEDIEYVTNSILYYS